jgi:hypothetical protein
MKERNYMKNAFFVLGLSMISMSSAFANASTLSVSCRDARGIPDFGYEVTIVSNSEGSPLAQVWEQSYAGRRPLGNYAVQLNNRGMQRIYTGNGFALTINLESMAPTSVHPARLIAGKIRANMICRALQ